MDDDAVTAPTDDELVGLARAGDAEAYAVLFRRHGPSVRAASRRLVRDSEADDVVSEAFAATLHQLRNGRGPTSSVRGYLLAAARHEAGRRAVRERRLVLCGDVETYGNVADEEASDERDHDVGPAYRTLPTRWQAVLWQLEVEGRRPHDLAVELGMTPNAVSALGMRARAGLRKAYAGRTSPLETAV